MNRVVHFEIQTEDPARTQAFYENAFGWKFEQAMSKDQGGMDYWTIITGEGPGINGGMYVRPGDTKLYTYDCTIAVADLDKTIESIELNGGKITRPKGEIKGIGLFAGGVDTEGNRFGLLQPTDWQPK